MNLNKVLLIGRLAADPEARTTPSGQLVVTLRIATNRVWNDKNSNEKREAVEFHTVIAWGRLAEIAQKYLLKGQMGFFEGRLQTRSWQGTDGVKRYRTEIVAENLQLGPKSAASGGAYTKPYENKTNMTNSQASTSTTFKADQAKDLDDIPIIGEEEPVSTKPHISDDEVQESEIDLKDIPF